MKEGEAPAVQIEPVLEVLPAPDGVDRLVGDQLLEQHRRDVPGDPARLQKADVEPGDEQALQIRLKGIEGGVGTAQPQELGAHVDQELDARKQGVELGQERDPRGL
jgi:hypothetical protein